MLPEIFLPVCLNTAQPVTIDVYPVFIANIQDSEAQKGPENI